MSQLTFLLYILAKSVSSIRPVVIEAILDWPNRTPNLDLQNLNPMEFCLAMQLNPKQTKKFLEYYQQESVEAFKAILKKHKILTINLFEENYPELLAQIPDPPLVLYCRGNIQLLNSNIIAIVGSRHASNYGRSNLERIIEDLTGSKLTIISGLAFGIDGLAHAAALKNGLATIAVLGSGIDDDSIYPRDNYDLAQQILKQNGLIISEYAPLSPAMKHQFIARNRIIAGLSQITIVIEAAQKSGALFTADFAADYNRTVLAMPGPINSQLSFGPHELIKNGAGLLLSGSDILNELGIELIAASEVVLNEQEKLVYEYIHTTPRDVEEILDFFNLSAPELYKIITQLELHGLITCSPPQTYSAK